MDGVLAYFGFYDEQYFMSNKLIYNAIQTQLNVLDLTHLEVIDESHKHNVPADAESHFKVVIVAKIFVGEGLVARHRVVNERLKNLFSGAIHALAIHAFTPEEWVARGGQFADSPECLGKNKV